MSDEQKNDGGPAFPHDADYIRGDKPGEYQFQVPFASGMSLRDYFAAASLSSLLPSLMTTKHFPRDESDVPATEVMIDRQMVDDGYQFELADLAYAIADAMLEARQQ